MPTYSISDPQTGRTLKITGDSPPTEKELDEIFASEAPADTTVPQESSTGNSPWNTPLPLPNPFGGSSFMVNPQQVGQTVKNLGLEGGGTTVGQIAGAPFAEVGGVQVGGAIGGFLGNTAAQLTTPGKDFSFGEALAAGAAGMVPGASLAKAGAKEVIIQGAKYAGANLAGKAIQTGVEEGRLPSPSEAVLSAGAGFAASPFSKFLDKGIRAGASAAKAQQDAVRRETLAAGRSLGLVVPPAVPNPNAVTNTLQSIAGKAATAQEAVLRNQPKINAAVRAEIGLPADAPLSPIAINTQRIAPNLVYDKIAKTSDEAANLLGRFKQSQADANELYAAYRNAPIKDPSLLMRAKAAEIEADAMKAGLGKVVGKDLMKEFDAARVQLAKIGLADRATRLGDGNVDAKVFGDALEHGERLTGNFQKLGRFQSAFGKYVQEASKTPPSGVDYLRMVGLPLLGGGAGYASGGPAGAIAGTLALGAAQKGSREFLLSPVAQRALANPSYGPKTADTISEFARLSTMSGGRKPKNKSNQFFFPVMSNPLPMQ